MPSKPAEQASEILQVLTGLNIFEADGSLKKEKNEVWSLALLQLKMKKHNLYITVQQDRHNLLSDLRRIHNHIVVDGPSETGTTQNYHVKEVMKSEIHESEQDFSHPLQVFYDLNGMKFSVSLNSCISHIFYKPFSVIYSLSEQKNVWNNFYTKKISKLSFIVLKNLIDRLSIRNIHSSSAYLCALTVDLDDITIPIFQIITEETNKVILKHFFREFLRLKYVIPCEIITQYSSILISLVTVFNKMSINDYNEICFQFITENLLNLPPVIIRIDIYSIVNHMYNCFCFSNDYIKKFFICCIWYVSLLDDFNIIKQTLSDIITVANCKYKTDCLFTSNFIFIKKIEESNILSLYDEFVKKSLKNSKDSFFLYFQQ